jgi:hypothetical protein
MLRILLAVLIGAAFSYPAHGAEMVQVPIICGTTAEMVAKAASTGAVLVGAGPAGDKGKALGEMYMSPDGEWAFFFRLAEGGSCVFASGHDWREIDSPPAPVGDPS